VRRPCQGIQECLEICRTLAAEHIALTDQATGQSRCRQLTANRFGLAMTADENADVRGVELRHIRQGLENQRSGDGRDALLKRCSTGLFCILFRIDLQELQRLAALVERKWADGGSRGHRRHGQFRLLQPGSHQVIHPLH